jgi:hypothetical protein
MSPSADELSLVEGEGDTREFGAEGNVKERVASEPPRHLASARKFSTIRGPSGVRIDSGWN